jgi:hypothetical protein
MKWSSAAAWLLALAVCVVYAVDRRRAARETEQLRAEIRASQNKTPVTKEVIRERVSVYLSPSSGAPASPEAPAPTASSASSPMPKPPSLDELNVGFEAQPQGGAAAARGEALLRDRVAASIPPSSSIERIECRASLCRMQLVHADIATSNKLLESLFIGPNAKLQTAGFVASNPEPTDDGHVRCAVFVPRGKLPE